MGATEGTSWPPPEWMILVGPGRLDLRMLDQETFWISGEGVVLQLDGMSEAHLHAVAEMLSEHATRFHFWAMVDTIYAISAARSGVPSGDLLEFALTGTSIADMEASAWLSATPLLRAIARLLAGSG